jgi:hypothetical protein
LQAKAELEARLAATLADLGGELAGCTEPWWLIGSAAMALHGAPVEVRDVDLLLAPADARAVLRRRGLAADPGSPSTLFSSDVFGSWQAPPHQVELFAGFKVRTGGSWHELVPETRQTLLVNGVALFVPSVEELIAWGRLFGRTKDSQREPLLAALLRHG